MVHLGDSRASAGGLPGSLGQRWPCRAGAGPADHAGRPKVNARRRIRPRKKARIERLGSRYMIDEPLNEFASRRLSSPGPGRRKGGQSSRSHSVCLLIAPKPPLPEQ
jgi:hypothetical protein